MTISLMKATTAIVALKIALSLMPYQFNTPSRTTTLTVQMSTYGAMAGITVWKYCRPESELIAEVRK